MLHDLFEGSFDEMTIDNSSSSTADTFGDSAQEDNWMIGYMG